MLRAVGESFIGNSSWRVCFRPEKTGGARFHVAETFFGRVGKIVENSSFPDGYRHLDFE